MCVQHIVNLNDLGRYETYVQRNKTRLEYLYEPERITAFRALPRVLKRGVIISEHNNHKLRGFNTITFAAPVEIGSMRGNMAVVVKQIGRNLYKTHRILMPDGSAFTFETKKAEPRPVKGAAEDGPHAPRISSANPSIARSNENDNENVRYSLPIE